MGSTRPRERLKSHNTRFISAQTAPSGDASQRALAAAFVRPRVLPPLLAQVWHWRCTHSPLNGSAARAMSAVPPPPPASPPASASVQERLHAAWLQRAAVSRCEAAGLPDCGLQHAPKQPGSRAAAPHHTCRRRSPGTAPINPSTGADLRPRLHPQPEGHCGRPQGAAGHYNNTLSLPAAARRVPPDRMDPAWGAAAALLRPSAPTVELDASDWELLELLRQEAEAAAAIPPAHPPRTHRTPTQRLPVQRPRHGQPTSPLARQLAALRSSLVPPQDGNTAAEMAAEAQPLDPVAAAQPLPSSGSSSSSWSAQQPTSPLRGEEALLAQAVCLLVPQELLVEAEAAAAAASPAAADMVAPLQPMLGACTSNAVRQWGRGSSTAAAIAVAGQQSALESSMQHPEEWRGLAPELVPAAEALQQHCMLGRWAAEGHCMHHPPPITSCFAASFRFAYCLTAAVCRYDAARELLGQAGPHAADLLEAPDDLGRRPLMLACAAGHGRLIKLLLRKGAHLDAQDKANGRTALHHAVLGGHRAVAQHLLKAGADATMRDRAGVSSAQLIAAWAAQQQGRQDVPHTQQLQQGGTPG